MIPPTRSPWLLAAAAGGFVIPNGIAVYWLAFEFAGLRAVLADKLAVAYTIDVGFAIVLLAIYFAKRPIGPVRWYWFLLLSLGGLSFSLPLYYWLNAPPPSRTTK